MQIFDNNIIFYLIIYILNDIRLVPGTLDDCLTGSAQNIFRNYVYADPKSL